MFCCIPSWPRRISVKVTNAAFCVFASRLTLCWLVLLVLYFARSLEKNSRILEMIFQRHFIDLASFLLVFYKANMVRRNWDSKWPIENDICSYRLVKFSNIGMFHLTTYSKQVHLDRMTGNSVLPLSLALTLLAVFLISDMRSSSSCFISEIQYKLVSNISFDNIHNHFIF